MTSRLIGADDLLRRLNAVGEPKPLLRALQLRTIREAKDRVPRKTGNLARSILAGTTGPNFTEVIVHASYGAFVEYGTRPHKITAKKGKVLAWPASPSGRRLSGRPTVAAARSGGLRFARSVNHPGTKAQPFLIPGAKAALDAAGIDTLVKAWNDAA